MQNNLIDIFIVVFFSVYIVILILFISIFITVRLYVFYKSKGNNKYIKQFSSDVELFLKEEKSAKDVFINIKYLESINIVLSENLQKYHEDEEKILKIKKMLLDKYILPKAIKIYKNKNFIDRFNVVLLLSHSNNVIIYEKELLDLIKDQRLIVRLNAVIIGCKNPTKNIIKAILNRVSVERDHVKEFYSLILIQNDKLKKIIFDELKHSNDPYYRSACYSILNLNKDDGYFYELIKRDASSNLEDLKLSAIGTMVAINLPSSYSYIFSLLKSPDWKIRNKIFRSFKKYHSTWAVDKISEFLNDESVWVRGSAIEALLSFGEEGEKILGSFDKDNKLKTDIEYYRMKA